MDKKIIKENTQEYKDFYLTDYEKSPVIQVVNGINDLLERKFVNETAHAGFVFKFNELKKTIDNNMNISTLGIKSGELTIKNTEKKEFLDHEEEDIEIFKNQVEKQKRYSENIKNLTKCLGKIINDPYISEKEKIETFSMSASQLIRSFENTNKLKHIMSHNQDIIDHHSLTNKNKSIKNILQEKQQKMLKKIKKIGIK